MFIIGWKFERNLCRWVAANFCLKPRRARHRSLGRTLKTECILFICGVAVCKRWNARVPSRPAWSSSVKSASRISLSSADIVACCWRCLTKGKKVTVTRLFLNLHRQRRPKYSKPHYSNNRERHEFPSHLVPRGQHALREPFSFFFLQKHLAMDGSSTVRSIGQ